jgi:hypothetical protein
MDKIDRATGIGPGRGQSLSRLAMDRLLGHKTQHEKSRYLRILLPPRR